MSATATSSAIVAAAAAAKAASVVVGQLETETKNALLLDLAERIAAAVPVVLAANARDVEAARASGLAPAKLQRLALSAGSLAQLCDSLRLVAALPDPVGQVTRDSTVPSGLRVRRVRSPLGVVAMIYEARPAVTIDAFALCFKAGNACILKGGKEAAASNAALAAIAHEALAARGLPAAALTLVATPSRDDLLTLLQQTASIDLVIPRGGHELIRFVAENSRIPTIQHYQGVCHIYVDAAADLAMALKICTTAKTSAPATCNAAECVLVHEAVAERFVTMVVRAYVEAGVQVRADARAMGIVGAGAAGVVPAAVEDFGREFLDMVVALAVVDSLDGAVAHIARHGSLHTEAIVTADEGAAERFARRVVASCVLVNASTRMNDGTQLGLGAEIGISTTKVHAFGPMGLEELTCTRFICTGTGQTR